MLEDRTKSQHMAGGDDANTRLRGSGKRFRRIKFTRQNMTTQD